MTGSGRLIPSSHRLRSRTSTRLAGRFRQQPKRRGGERHQQTVFERRFYVLPLGIGEACVVKANPRGQASGQLLGEVGLA